MIELNKKIPNFKAKALVNEKEKEISLNDFKGKKIALYFYPKDLTPGCTWQAENLRDNISKLNNKNIEIIGISKDPIKSHEKFVCKKELPFILISDEDLEIHKIFDNWQMKKFMGKEYMGTLRRTFLIDENQKLIKIIEKPKVKDHTNEILNGFGLN